MYGQDTVFSSDLFSAVQDKARDLAVRNIGKFGDGRIAAYIDIKAFEPLTERIYEAVPAVSDKSYRLIKILNHPGMIGKGDLFRSCSVTHGITGEKTAQDGALCQAFQNGVKGYEVFFEIGQGDQIVLNAHRRGSAADRGNHVEIAVNRGRLGREIAFKALLDILKPHRMLKGLRGRLENEATLGIVGNEQRLYHPPHPQKREYLGHYPAVIQTAGKVKSGIKSNSGPGKPRKGAADPGSFFQQQNAAPLDRHKQSQSEPADSASDHDVVISFHR